jgi:hypothetical protein
MKVSIFSGGGGWFFATETCELTFHKTFAEVMDHAYTKIRQGTHPGTTPPRDEARHHR